jgi:hypothetical protein
MCFSEENRVRISEGVTITCSYDLKVFNKSYHQSKTASIVAQTRDSWYPRITIV